SARRAEGGKQAAGAQQDGAGPARRRARCGLDRISGRVRRRGGRARSHRVGRSRIPAGGFGGAEAGFRRMRVMSRRFCIRIAVAMLSFASVSVQAQPAAPAPSAIAAPVAPIPWSSLSPAEQKVLASVHKNWDELPPPAQQRLLRGAQRWSNLNPEQRAKVQERFQKWNAMTPDQRAKLRERY